MAATGVVTEKPLELEGPLVELVRLISSGELTKARCLLGLSDVSIELPSPDDMWTDFDVVFSKEVIADMRAYRDRGIQEHPSLPVPGDLGDNELLAAEEWTTVAEGVLRRWARPRGITRNFYYACRDLSIPMRILKKRMNEATKLLCYRLVCRRLLQDCVRRGKPRAWLVDLKTSPEGASTVDSLAEGTWKMLTTLIERRRRGEPTLLERVSIWLRLSEERTYLIKRIDDLSVPRSTEEMEQLMASPPETEVDVRGARRELCEHVERSEERLQMAGISGILDQCAPTGPDTLSGRIDNLAAWYRTELDPRFRDEEWLRQSCRFLACMHIVQEFVITPVVQALPRPDGMGSRAWEYLHWVCDEVKGQDVPSVAWTLPRGYDGILALLGTEREEVVPLDRLIEHLRLKDLLEPLSPEMDKAISAFGREGELFGDRKTLLAWLEREAFVAALRMHALNPRIPLATWRIESCVAHTIASGDPTEGETKLMEKLERHSIHHDVLKRSSVLLCTPSATEEFCSAVRELEEATVARAQSGALLTELAGFRRPYLVEGRIDVSTISSEAAAERTRIERVVPVEEVPLGRLGETVADIGPLRPDAYKIPLIPSWMRGDVEILREISSVKYEKTVPPSYESTISRQSLRLFMVYGGMTLMARDDQMRPIDVAVTVGGEAQEKTRQPTGAETKNWVHVLSDGSTGVLVLSKAEEVGGARQWKPVALYMLVDHSMRTMKTTEDADREAKQEMGRLLETSAPFGIGSIDWPHVARHVEIAFLGGVDIYHGVTAQLACILLLQRICAPVPALLDPGEARRLDLNFSAILKLWAVTAECILSQLAALPLMSYATERWALAEETLATLERERGR